MENTAIIENIKKAQEELKNRLTDYNNLILELVEEKKKDRFLGDAKFYCYDFEKAKAVLLDDMAIEKAKSKYLFHIWAEYDVKDDVVQKKINFFCKDIDATSGNVHVVPGIIQEFKREKKPEKMSYVCVENDEIILRNVQNGYRPFAEPCEDDKDSWWVPGENIEHIIKFNFKKSEEAQHLRKSLQTLRGEIRTYINKLLRNGIECESRGGNGSINKYTFLVWLNVSNGESKKKLSTFKIGYDKECGLISRFNVLDYDSDNKRIVDKTERVFKTVYKSFKGEEKALTEFELIDLDNIAKLILQDEVK